MDSSLSTSHSGQTRSRRRMWRPRSSIVLASIATTAVLQHSSTAFLLDYQSSLRLRRNLVRPHTLSRKEQHHGRLFPHSVSLASSRESRNEQRQTGSKHGKKQQSRSPNKRTSLQWVVHSIENLNQDKTREMPGPSSELVKCLQRLVEARTQREIARVGRQLESIDIGQTEALDVQERVIKAAALAGLLSLSLGLLSNLLAAGTLPSPMAYTAVLMSLRQAGRTKSVEELMYQLGEAAQSKNDGGSDGLDVVAFNTYLATLCDQVTKGGNLSRNTSRGTFPSLEAAREWLKPGASTGMCGTEPDATSYATVLHAAAFTEDRSMVDDLWREMEERRIQPSLYAYNSLLRAIRSGGRACDSEALGVFDKLNEERKNQLDQYTLDLVLTPLIRSNRGEQVETLLRDFVESRSSNPRLLSRAFEAFLNTLVSDGELSTAQALFDKYLLPPEIIFHSSSLRIHPTVRHFNLMIAGYRKRVDNRLEKLHGGSGIDRGNEESPTGSGLSRCDLTDEIETLREQCMELYRIMLDFDLTPDAYTLTTMMGVASSSEQVSILLRDTILDSDVKVTPAVLRATTKAYGDCGDPSSACWFFDCFSSNTMSTRTWNGLLGALARGSAIDSADRLSIELSGAAIVLATQTSAPRKSWGLGDLIESATCPEAVLTILRLMDGDRPDRPAAPPPNSQTYCIAASALQHDDEAGPELALELFRNATTRNIPADGRFANAILRCFGDDIVGALAAWKQEIRRACLAHECRTRTAPVSIYRSTGKNLIAAYHGLLYVCGRSLRPDVALRVVYAMSKDGIEANEVALNCYRSGKRGRIRTRYRGEVSEDDPKEKGIRLAEQFENLLLIECTKYDTNDKRRTGEKRVRIIL